MGYVVTVGDSRSKRRALQRRFSSVGGRNDRISVSRVSLVSMSGRDCGANERLLTGAKAGPHRCIFPGRYRESKVAASNLNILIVRHHLIRRQHRYP